MSPNALAGLNGAGNGGGMGNEAKGVPVDQAFLDNPGYGVPAPSSNIIRLAQAVRGKPGKAGPSFHAQQRPVPGSYQPNINTQTPAPWQLKTKERPKPY